MRAKFLSKLRRTEVFGMTMTELVLTLLFILLFAVLPGSSGPDEPDLDRKNAELKAEVLSLQQNLSKTKKELNEVKSLFFEVLKTLKMSLVLNNIKNPPEMDNIDFKATSERIFKDKAIKEGSGGTGKQNCLGSGSFLLAITMYDNGYNIKKLWKDSDSGIVNELPIFQKWIDGDNINTSTFKNQGAQVRKWCDFNANNCRYSVKVYDATTNKTDFISQLEKIEDIFYVKRMRGNPDGN
jgi:hypothetical protein